MIDFGSINGSWIILLLIGVFQLNLSSIWSLNDEGIALLKFKEKVVNDPFGGLKSWDEKNEEAGHCSWFGIHCANGHVISLNLENLCLEGTLAPELRHLLHIKAIILRNNSFSGTIPREIEGLKELELLDLAYNNIQRPLLHENQYSFAVLLLDCNGQSCHVCPELEKQTLIFEDDNRLAHSVLPNTRHNGQEKGTEHHRMLADATSSGTEISGSINPHSIGSAGKALPFGQAPSTPKSPPPPVPPASTNRPPPPVENNPPQEPNPSPGISALEPPPPPEISSPPVSSPPVTSSPPKKKKTVFIVVGAVGGFVLLVLAIGLCFWSGITIRKSGPWSKGLTGQLQRAFVSGIQNLRRFELETACEDFSNVIGTCSIGTIYKGTLSNGVEISVISLAASSAKDWSKNLETHFRKKMETLSKVNHKNFINLVGYCTEEEPFTRMMVFEYAPNGSLFEHLHVREAEHLDWGIRLRVAMGMAYCLDYMHQLEPPVTHPNLNSSSVHLSEDYAAKISDFCFWNEVAAAQVQPIDLANLGSSSATPESNVYNYGLVLLEMMTGRISHTVVSNNTVDDWVSEYLSGEKPLQELMDPMLRRYNPEQLAKLSEVISKCLHPDPQLRPAMKDVSARMKEITGLNRDKAGPRLSPLWWAELEETRSVNGEET